KNTQNLAKITEFTGKIKNGTLEDVDLMVVINSLKLAITCLSTVAVTLSDLSHFWEAIEITCKNLAGDTTIDELTNRVGVSNAAEIANFVTTSKKFGKTWFIMECQWQALYLVCDAYYNASVNANDTLKISLTRPESSGKEHWTIARELAEYLESKLGATLLSSQSRSEEFKKRVALAEKARDKMIEDIHSVQ
ncbi:MAG: hypothetical protein LBC19_13130, partial [Tannerella sp.]|nr:hypothetical protein [Tannerella sp.]